jgi:hypothetical protein
MHELCGGVCTIVPSARRTDCSLTGCILHNEFTNPAKLSSLLHSTNQDPRRAIIGWAAYPATPSPNQLRQASRPKLPIHGRATPTAGHACILHPLEAAIGVRNQPSKAPHLALPAHGARPLPAPDGTRLPPRLDAPCVEVVTAGQGRRRLLGAEREQAHGTHNLLSLLLLLVSLSRRLATAHRLTGRLSRCLPHAPSKTKTWCRPERSLPRPAIGHSTGLTLTSVVFLSGPDSSSSSSSSPPPCPCCSCSCCSCVKAFHHRSTSVLLVSAGGR